MSPRCLSVVSGMVLAGLLFAGSSLAQMTPSQEGGAAQVRQPIERFSGPVGVRAGDGSSRDVQVVVRNWIIDNRRRIASFPEQGFLLVQLTGGALVTVIDGQRTERKSGEFWTVPAGSTMSIETGDDSAALQTVAIRKPGP
jgi:hypothetical protein